MLDKNGNLNLILSENEDVQARWTEHFKEVHNVGEPENPVLSDEVCESELSNIIEEISVGEPILGEVKQALKKMEEWESTRN